MTFERDGLRVIAPLDPDEGQRYTKPITEEDHVLELLHTHLGFLFPKVFIFLLVIISHYPVSYILGENIPPGEYSLSVDTSV
jgi:hypothetical protein